MRGNLQSPCSFPNRHAVWVSRTRIPLAISLPILAKKARGPTIMLRDDVLVDVPLAALATHKLLFLFFFQAALLATGAGGQSSGATRITPERTDSLSYYAHCKYTSDLSIVSVDRLPGRGLRYRTVETSDGTRRISMVEGYRIMLAYRGGVDFAKLHVEESGRSQYLSDKDAAIKSFATLVSPRGDAVVSEQRNYKGFDIYAWNDPAMEGDGPTGVYLLFRDSAHLIVTIYFFGPKPHAGQIRTREEYNALRDGVVNDFTTCASGAGSQTIAAGVRLAELQPGTKFLLDSFDSVTQWHTNPSSGVEITIHPDSGRTGRGMRVDFDFHGHTGYGIVGRQVNLELPANYRFEFAVRGSAPSNTLEFKLVDPTGANVWWSNNPGFVFAPEWTSVVRTKREICFAWGPSGGGEIRRVAGIEFAITAGSGGKGSIWIDDLSVAAVDPDSPFDVIAPVAAAPIVGTWESAAVQNGAIGRTLDFRSDGSATVTIGTSTAFVYDKAANRLTTTINDPAGGESVVHTSLIRIERDTLTQQDVNGATPDVWVRRGGKSDDSILGIWSFVDNTGASAFVQFASDGRGLFRVPMSSCSGTWTTPGGTSLALRINGMTAGFDYSIQSATLRMKDSQGREISYTRRTPPE